MSINDNRTQIVYYGDNLTSSVPVRTGVSPGSILSQIFFLIGFYIKNCKFHVHADDTKIYHSFIIKNLATSNDSINSDLANVLVFSDAYGFKLST